MTAEFVVSGATETCMPNSSYLKTEAMCHRNVSAEGTWQARRNTSYSKRRQRPCMTAEFAVSGATETCMPHSSYLKTEAKEHGKHEGTPVTLSEAES